MKRKILFIVTKSENGGAQKWVKEQLDITKEYFDTYLATNKSGWLVDNSNFLDALIDKKIESRFSLLYLYKLIKFIKKNRIDLIVASSANAGLYARLAKIFTKVKVIYVAHGWSAIYNGGRLKSIYIFIERILSILSDSILCVSKADYKNAVEKIGIKNSKLKLIRNKIFPLKRVKESFSEGRIKLVTVSRFRYPKRNDLLIEAVKDLDVELYLVGDGPLRGELESLKSNNIHFLGEIDNFSDYYKYDIFVLISDSEGLPLSALEAMSAKLPLVLSRVGGCVEVVDNNGVLVDNMVDNIKNGIKMSITNIYKYSENSYKLFNKEFNMHLHKDIYIEYYKKLI